MERAQELYEKIIKEGKSAIEEFILTRKTEELFLDFKRSGNNGDGKSLNDHDRNNLGKAISGFGNSEGGIIVWGVNCSKHVDGSDVANAEHPITNVKRFVSWLNGAISGCTIPPHTGVQNEPIEIDSDGNGFVVTHIPKSEHAPHQAIPSRKYFIRAGSDFMPTPHDVLSGMFGKRPQPKIKGNYMIFPFMVDNNAGGRIRIHIDFHICNNGKGIAESLFASAVSLSSVGPNCSFQFFCKHEGFRSFKSLSCSSFIGGLDIRLPPGGWLDIAEMILDLTPPFTKKLKVEGVFGCGNAPPLKFAFNNSAENIQSWYNDVSEDPETFNFDNNKRTEKANELLGLD